MDWGLILKVIVTIIGFFLAAIELELVFKSAREKVRKRTIVAVFLSLILFTVWDTTSDYVGNKKEEDKRDSLITIDSLRAVRIIDNLNKNLEKLNETSGIVLQTNDTLKAVKDSIVGQVVTLKDVIKKSEEFTKLEKLKFKAGKPIVTIYSKDTKVDIDSTDNKSIINMVFVNSGKRSAVNVSFHYRVMLIELGTGKVSFVDNENGEPPYLKKVLDMPPVSEDSYRMTSKVLAYLNAMDFKEQTTGWCIILKMYYSDEYGNNHEKLIMLTGSKFDGNDFKYGELKDGFLVEMVKAFLKSEGEYEKFFEN